MDKRPIAFFDSGLCGLTVVQKVSEIFPNENIIYFGDTARVPYGGKSKDTIVRYSKEICEFLINKNVKLIIIACGTVSSIAFDILKKTFDLPIINVIEPTSKYIKGHKVGVIATKATISSKSWEKAIIANHPDIKVLSKPCPLFVPIVEEGLANSIIADEAIELYLEEFKKKKIDELILGCTHYPILENKIKKYLGNQTKTINVNEYCVKEVYRFLKSSNMLNESSNKPTKIAYVTDNVSLFKKNANRFCNVKFDKVQKVKVDKV